MDAANPFGAPAPGEHAALYGHWFSELTNGDPEATLPGAAAASFFSRSGLPRPLLAKVWALADARRAGVLDAAGFATACELCGLAQREGDVSAARHAAAVAAGDLAPPDMERGGGGRSSTAGAPRDASPPRAKLPPSIKAVASVAEGLKSIYFSKVKPVEDAYKFASFYGGSTLTPADFAARPAVLVCGAYSAGKTTFIRHLLGGKDYCGAHIGPEPTTDKFVVVHAGADERRTPGNTVVVQPDMPWAGLASFGSAFLSRFEAASCDARLLDEITLVDSPGVLAGEKQRVERGYDFVAVTSWLASRADLILVLFDPHKLDISDELKRVIASFQGNEEKVRVVLNKADSVDMQALMRVHGALMWSLGRVLRTPEVARVYVSSFNGTHPPRTDANPGAAPLFAAEAAALMADLRSVPARSLDRRVSELVKRVRAAKMHALIVGRLKQAMPAVMGKAKASAKLLADLPAVFHAVAREHHLPLGDMPDPARYRDILASFDLAAFPKLREKDVKALDDALTVDIPALVAAFDNPYRKK